MKISIIGMGYVGCVTAAIAAKEGHDIIGVDISKNKIDMINSGISPIIEPGLQDLFTSAKDKNKLAATTDLNLAIKNTSLSIVCVGTPSKEDGSTDLSFIDKVSKDLVKELRKSSKIHTIMVRSTIPPGTMEKLFIPRFSELSNINICYNPEFLREGTAVADYYNPPYIIAAVNTDNSRIIIEDFYRNIKAEMIFTSFKTAEISKVVNNIFHALKIVFANEIKRFSEAFNLDDKEIMDIVKKDKKLNLSPVYLNPGFSYGGSCLPKEIEGFLALSSNKNLDLPVISGISISNDIHFETRLTQILQLKKEKIAILGLSFKNDTDDLRNSPYLKLAKRLVKAGCHIKIFDKTLNTSKLLGSNRKYIEEKLSNIDDFLITDISDISDSEVILVNHDYNLDSVLNENHIVIHLNK